MPVEVALPNGTVVSCLQKHEVPLVELEVQGYFANGIRLKPGDTVFDVGANIGLFSLAACEHCDNDLRVYAFEPIKPIFELLRSNLGHCGPQAQVEAFAFGLAGIAETVSFAYYPRAPVLSTAYPDEEADLKAIKGAVLNSIIELDEAPLAVRCLRWIPRPLRALILHFALQRTLRPEVVRCELRTLSQVVRDHGIERIDLLKVDVEKAELDVFRGIEEQDWAKIQQIIVDVHDFDGRLEEMTAILRDHGLVEIKVEQPPTLKGSDIYTVFSTRKRAAVSRRVRRSSGRDLEERECAISAKAG